MAVEVNDTNGTILANVWISTSRVYFFEGSLPVDRAQQRKRDSVVTTQCDETWQCLALLGGARLLSIGMRRAAQQQVMALFDLLKGVCVIVPVQVHQLESNWSSLRRTM
jgi:hypothetical protein